jgi:hypothetical protein
MAAETNHPEGLSVHLWCAGGVDAWDLIRSSLARRRNEVAEARQQMARNGLAPIVLPAVEALFAATARAHAVQPFTGTFAGTSTDEAIDWLGRHVLASHA